MILTAAKYAVMGNPVEHSLSPVIQQMFAKQQNVNINYEKIFVPLDQFPQYLKKFRDEGGRGLNITLPFKEQALREMDNLSENAKIAGAVNMIIIREDGSFLGDNNDGLGLVRDISVNKNCILQDRNILILGAGGATRGILYPLLQQKPASITIVNRAVEKADALTKEFSQYGVVQSCGYHNLPIIPFHIMIDATSIALQGEHLPLPKEIFAHSDCYYMLAYGDKTRAALDFAKRQGVKACYDGIGMLVELAADCFFKWHHIMPNTKPILSTLITTPTVG